MDQVVHGEKSPAGVSGDIRQRASLGAGHEGDWVRSNCKALRTVARYAETEINGERRIGINGERRSVLRPLSGRGDILTDLKVFERHLGWNDQSIALIDLLNSLGPLESRRIGLLELVNAVVRMSCGGNGKRKHRENAKRSNGATECMCESH